MLGGTDAGDRVAHACNARGRVACEHDRLGCALLDVPEEEGGEEEGRKQEGDDYDANRTFLHARNTEYRETALAARSFAIVRDQIWATSLL